ncbi:MAG: hypothetical protein U0M42_04155 [Acutalibacteraceae bacterium]|nr:hypothetical protein [Acutalibacteraceae bacterium]
MKKKTSFITFCAVVTALISAFMVASYFPYFTYAIPAVASAFIILPLCELNKKYALLTYIASAVIVLFAAEMEAKLMFVCFFGYYPILKAIYEKTKSRVLEYILKFLTFNGAIILIYGVISKIMGISLEGIGDFGKYSVLILWVMGNIAFILYDICLTRLCGFYIYRFHEKIKKIMRF